VSNDDAEFKHLPARTAGEAGLEGDVAIENTAAGCGGEGGAGADGPAAPSGLEEDGLRQRREAREADSREEGTPRVRGREKEEERNARQKEERATLRFFNFSLHTHTPVHTQHACFAHTLPARAQPRMRAVRARTAHTRNTSTRGSYTAGSTCQVRTEVAFQGLKTQLPRSSQNERTISSRSP